MDNLMDERPRRRGFEALGEVWSRRGKLAILAFALPFAAIASAAAFLPDLYRSTATILIEHHHVQEALVKPAVTDELETRIRTLSQEILSRARLRTLIDRFGLYPRLRRSMSEDAVVETMRKDILVEFKSIEPTPGARSATVAFTLSYQSRDPRMAAAVANTLASSFVQQNSRARTRRTGETARFLKAELEQMKARHDEQERRVREFKMRHSGDLPEQMAPNLATLERLNTRLYMNRDNQQRAMERRETLMASLAEAGRPGLIPGSLELGPSRLARLRQELAELRARYSDRYPEVVRVRQEIAQLERGGLDKPKEKGREEPPPDPAQRRVEEMVRGLDSELRILKAEETRLQESINAYQTRVDAAPQREQQFRELARDYETTKELYSSLLNRYEEAQLAGNMEEARQGEQFKILDPAVPSKLPAAPNRLQLSLIGAFLCLALSAGVVVLAEQRDTSFHTMDDLRAFTRVPVLLSIPRIVTRGDAARRRLRWGLGMVAAIMAVVVLAAGSWTFTRNNDDLVRLLSRGGARKVAS
ncbi:MAG TPA: GNVR domain-containing protein [Candidatus Polarisedimenticolia bacterium]|nr:GNVR domain-containing protein [Candidatus Polarisedimenticolia bacterium]